MRKWRRVFTSAAVGVAGVAAVLLAACSGGESLAEAHKVAADAPVTQECDHPPAGAGRLTMTADDGTELGAITLGPTNATTAVVLIHGWGQDACVFAPVGATIAAAHPDVRIIALALRGRGASQGSKNDTDKYATDGVTAIEAAREGGASHVVLVGTSVGAATVLAAGSLSTPPVDGVVAVSPPSAIGNVDVASTVSATNVPTWLVVAEGDTPFVKSRDAIAPRFTDLRQNVTLDGDLHGMRLMLSGAQPSILALVDEAISAASVS